MEILDIVDEMGNPTGKTIERKEAHKNGIMHRTAHVWFLRKNNNKVQILLQKRSESKDSFPGCFDISSAGHIPAGVGFTASAVREIKEELGIDVLESELIECGDRKVVWDEVFFGVPFHDRQVSRVFCVWKDIDESSFSIQKEELASVLWMDFEECIQAVQNNTIKHCINLNELYMVRDRINKN